MKSLLTLAALTLTLTLASGVSANEVVDQEVAPVLAEHMQAEAIKQVKTSLDAFQIPASFAERNVERAANSRMTRVIMVTENGDQVVAAR